MACDIAFSFKLEYCASALRQTLDPVQLSIPGCKRVRSVLEVVSGGYLVCIANHGIARARSRAALNVEIRPSCPEK